MITSRIAYVRRRFDCSVSLARAERPERHPSYENAHLSILVAQFASDLVDNAFSRHFAKQVHQVLVECRGRRPVLLALRR